MSYNCYNCQDLGIDSNGNFCHCLNGSNSIHASLESIRRLRVKFIELENRAAQSEYYQRKSENFAHLNFLQVYFGEKIPNWLMKELYSDILISYITYITIRSQKEKSYEFELTYQLDSYSKPERLILNDSNIEDYVNQKTIKDIIT